MIVKLLTEYHLEFLSLKGGCIGSSESTLVKMSNCWKSHATAIVRMSVLCLSSSYCCASVCSVIVAFPCHTHLFSYLIG